MGEYTNEHSVRHAIIFIGLQGSGKTYYYNQHFAGKFRHISLDDLHTRSREKTAFQSCIDEGVDFVVDNTNPTREDRARYIGAAKAAGYIVTGYFFESRLRDCIRRNNQRTKDKRVPAKAIAATSNRLEMPSKDEGFDELFFVKRISETMMAREEWKLE